MSFTSDLSVAEFALAAEAGLRPLRLVGGEGVFRLRAPTAWTEPGYLKPGQTRLLTGQAARWNDARATVLARLRDEAAACGAVLVTGVSLRCRVPGRRPSLEDPADAYREFTVTGTALGRRSGEDSGGEPVLTNLRLPEYARLTAAGLRPAGLVTATAVVAVRSCRELDVGSSDLLLQPPAAEQNRMWAARNRPGDRPELHDATRRAFSAALEKLRADAARAGATGVESISTERDRCGWRLSEWAEHTAVFVHATGTAVTASPSGPGPASGLAIMPVRHLSA